MKRIALGLLAMLAACVTVREVDLAAWVGQPVSALDRHPVWITVPVVRTITPDGIEIRDYVNGVNVTSCAQGGSVFAGTVDWAAYNQFSQCASRFAACHNVFQIRDGIVESYTPIGRGARCYTIAALQPGYNGPVNVR